MSDLPGGYQPEKGGDGAVIFPNIGPPILTPAPRCPRCGWGMRCPHWLCQCGYGEGDEAAVRAAEAE